ncbi:MAG: penicillin-binding protein 1C [Candidatus Omnitrophota bacterium]
MKKRKGLIVSSLAGGLILAVGIYFIFFFTSFDRDRFFKTMSYSTTFYDRNGKTLRAYVSTEETYTKPCLLSEISPHFLRAIVLIEDKTFYNHHGVVLSSLFRAFWQNIRGKRIVSGGSTITMQLAKSVDRHRDRHIFNKLSEIFSALRFERHLSKSEILEAYINRLPFSNQIYGVNGASWFYFGKAPSQLSLNQAIFLALIPRSPSQFNPNRHLAHLKRKWKTILEFFKASNYITLDEYQRAQHEGIHFQVNPAPFFAPHFIEMIREKYGTKPMPEQVDTTLDYEIQHTMEGLIREHLVRLKSYNVGSAAAIVMDNHTHEVLGFVGSPNYFNSDNAGNVNLAGALRQPGSTLKPFVYGLALESGYTPSSVLPDIKFPSRGGFFPQNHDGREHGPLRLRTALACSYNIPAFYLAMKLKPSQVIDKLQKAGFAYLKSDPGFYGETIALGSGEVKLLDLVTAYSAFACNGVTYSPAFIKNEPLTETRILEENAAFLIWDILADPSARFASFGYDSSMNLPFPLAIKTGTSKGFRDKWAVGVNSEYTVGVWIGNPRGENMADTSHVGNASTILRDIFLAIQKDWTKGAVPVPSGLTRKRICALSGERASPDCPDTLDEYFDSRNFPQTLCTWHIRRNGQLRVNYPELYKEWALRTHPAGNLGIDQMKKQCISFPQEGDFFYISGAIPVNSQQITFEVMGFRPGEAIDYYLDGVLYQRDVFPHFPFWPLKRGDHRLTIKREQRVIDEVKFVVR